MGGADRWQDKAAIDYPNIRDACGVFVADVSRPIYASADSAVDLWVSYRRALWTGRVKWKLQFNVANVFADDALFPASVNTDGPTATFRVPPPAPDSSPPGSNSELPAQADTATIPPYLPSMKPLPSCCTMLGLALASSLTAATTVAEVEAFRVEQGRLAAHWLLKQDIDAPEEVFAALRERRKDESNYSLMQDGMRLCRDVAIYAHARKDAAALRAAATVADALLHQSATPSGAFIEWDRNTWLDDKGMWRTIPWGVAFCGNRAFEAWMVLKDEFSPGQRAYWRQALENTGAWIHRNPVVGGYVFNAGIDLCGLLWRIGNEFGHPEWTTWALAAAAHRIERDIDEEGWIQAEDGGSSGYYQLYGAEMLAQFAWEAKAPVLNEAVKKIFARCGLRYSTATMDWPGNYGTRTSALRRLPGTLVLAAAALGNSQAAYFARTYGEVRWADDFDLWQAALAQPATAPVYPAVTEFKGISGTVVREGPWVAYFGNYNRSTWSHGFADLWHAGHGDWVFSTLHSLAPLATSVRAKSRLGDTSDWAGFPHVRVTAGDTHFDSQQRIDTLETKTGPEGVDVRWTEPLLDGNGARGGEMRSRFRFHGDTIEMEIALGELAGDTQVDFHFLRRPNGFIRLWIGQEVADIFAGRFLRTNGHYDMRTLKPGQPRLYGVQVDRTVFGFEAIDVPAAAALSLIPETPTGLHTGNLGGFRFRIALPAAEKNPVLKLRLRATEP